MQLPHDKNREDFKLIICGNTYNLMFISCHLIIYDNDDDASSTTKLISCHLIIYENTYNLMIMIMLIIIYEDTYNLMIMLIIIYEDTSSTTKLISCLFLVI